MARARYRCGENRQSLPAEKVRCLPSSDESFLARGIDWVQEPTFPNRSNGGNLKIPFLSYIVP